MRYRQLGNPTNKAWLAGWDAGIVGHGAGVNPYRRKPQHGAWERGRVAGRRSDDHDVAELRRRADAALAASGH